MESKMTDGLQIRAATSSDRDTIAQFNMAMALETEEKALVREVITAGVQGLIENPSLGFYLMAERNGELVGSLMVTTEWSDWRNGVMWWIQSVYVVPNARRQGIYRALYQRVKELAEENRNVCGFRLYVEKENSVAQCTYRALGMDNTHYLMFEELKNDRGFLEDVA